jgi:hypothetical protein
MKSTKEIEAEIKTLKTFKPKIQRTTFFGDDNHAAIEAQIEVLKQQMTEDEVFGKQDSEEWTEHQSGAARDAANWLSGDEETSPSSSWKSLVKE